MPDGRFPCQATDRRLNHGPRPDCLTPESVTATGYKPTLPAAQLGRQSFSQYVASPVAVVPVQFAQVTCSTPAPPSPQASVMELGRTLGRNGGALVQSATTLGSTADAATGDGGAAADGVAGAAWVAGAVGAGDGAVGPVGGAAVAVRVIRGVAAAWVCPGEQAVKLTAPATASSEQSGNVMCESLMSPVTPDRRRWLSRLGNDGS